ncbi:ACP S-malonyltransferase [bacterium]|nr:ACP S-malonyltransferase [bacterium]
MARDLHEMSALARTRFAQANEILGFNLAEVCFDGPEDELRQTRVTQPALFVHSVIVAELLAERGIKPSCAAGHSLGEYSALACADAFSFETGLALVRVRAEAMQRAGQQNPGTMAAVVGLADEKLEQVCSDASSAGVVVPANFNSSGQIVISGDVPAVERAMELAKSAGAKLVKKLVVSGAFHSPLMKLAADELGAALESADIRTPRVPVISNVTGKAHTTPDSIREMLAAQLLSPVRWTACQSALAEMNPDSWLEVGTGSVLAGLLKRSVSGASATPVGTATEIESLTSGVTA